MRRAKWACWAGLFGLMVGVAPGQEQPAPAKADAITSGFRAYVVADGRFDPKNDHNRVGKLHDLVTDHGLNPVLAVFSRTVPTSADSPVVALMQRQDELAVKYKSMRLGCFAVFLTLTKDFPEAEDRDTRIAEVAAVARQINTGAKAEDKTDAKAEPKEGQGLQMTVGLAEATVEEDGKQVVPQQVKALGIADNDDVVVIFYHRYKVIGRWAFTKDKPPTPNDILAISTAVDNFLDPRTRKKNKK